MPPGTLTRGGKGMRSQYAQNAIRRIHVNKAKNGAYPLGTPRLQYSESNNLFPVRLLETVHNKSLGRHAYRDSLARGLDS